MEYGTRAPNSKMPGTLHAFSRPFFFEQIIPNMKYRSPRHPTPDPRHELRVIRRELRKLKTLFSSLNEPPVYYGTAQAIARYPIRRETLSNCEDQGILSPMTVGRNKGWLKQDLDELKRRGIK